MGMVVNTVKVAQGLCFMALTTTRPSTAMTITTIISVPSMAAVPPTAPSSSRAICPRLLPLRRVEMNSTVMSCTQPPSTAPTISHSVPGR